MGQLILTFEWDGKTVHKETKGFVGKQCVEKTEFIEGALGKPQKRSMKADYYEEPEKVQENKTRY